MALDLEASSSQPSTTPGSLGAPEEKDGVPSLELAVPPAIDEPLYTIFTHPEKRFISYLASFGAMFSTLSSYIYMPAITPIAADLGVSVAMVNLTVTSYMIVAGVAPAFMGDLADQGGRRPAYVLMFTLVVAANLGLALQNSYAALFVLRMLQSAGASGKDNCYRFPTTRTHYELTKFVRIVWRGIWVHRRHHNHCGTRRLRRYAADIVRCLSTSQTHTSL